MRRILTFFVRRLAAAMFTLITMITLTFVLFWAIPSDPANFVYPTAQHLTDYQLQHANHLLGIDRPLIEQYGSYLWHLLRFDFGTQWAGSQVTGREELVRLPIGPQLAAVVPPTLSIILGGALLVVLIAVPLGAISGRRIGSLSDRTISLIVLVGICTHPMVVGLTLSQAVGKHVKWIPPGGYCPLTGDPALGCNGPADWAWHLILPWFTFALLFLALYTRMVRASVAETMHADFVRTARAKGVGEMRVMTRHVLPNAGMRILTMVGMEIGTAIGICVFIESAYGISGLGRLSVTALFGTAALDLPLILAVVTVITTIVVIGNLLVDLLYALIDPRVGQALREGDRRSLAGEQTRVVA
jgi:peptide/nickel transport system permease protein